MNPLERGDQQRPGTAAAATWYFRYIYLGFQFALAIGICVFGGYWIDRKFDSSPIGTLGGAAFGFAAAMVWLYRSIYGKGGARESAEKKGE